MEPCKKSLCWTFNITVWAIRGQLYLNQIRAISQPSFCSWRNTKISRNLKCGIFKKKVKTKYRKLPKRCVVCLDLSNFQLIKHRLQARTGEPRSCLCSFLQLPSPRHQAPFQTGTQTDRAETVATALHVLGLCSAPSLENPFFQSATPQIPLVQIRLQQKLLSFKNIYCIGIMYV